MLRTPAPYPEVGAEALIVEAHRSRPVRILARDRVGRTPMALVAFQDRDGRYGASGNKRVRLADLVDPSPLSDAEEAEYRRLDRELASKARPDARKARRLEALRLRSIHATRSDGRAPVPGSARPSGGEGI